ncbi:MAG TPA: YicC/YloC family endoribonuclease [Rhodothermales bacterium]
MVASMTGFGRGSSDRGGVNVWVELRSVNSRFLEISTRLPRVVSDREQDVQARIRQAFARGRVSVQVQLGESSSEDLAIRVNPAAARAYRNLLDELRKAAGIQEPVQLQHLLTFSDVFAADDADEHASDRLWDALQEALDAAIADMKRMRAEEGLALRRDLENRLDTILKSLDAVERRAPQRIEEARVRLTERLQEVLGDERLSRDRIEQEVVLYADRLDVTEECVRLRSHVNLFREALASDEATGRRLNFLVQEMNREINTIGSKANDAAVAHLAVDMKEELEKIREQVQNVE